MKSFPLLILNASCLLMGMALSGFQVTDANHKEIPSEPQSAQPGWISALPRNWTKAWSNPPAKLRPLQILHGIPANQATTNSMRSLKKLGLGGIVCNVAFDDYLESEKYWETLIRAVQACQEVGLVVWIYDEHGYPSGAAGGLVLKRNKNFEALALTYDPSHPQPFDLRPAYEHTHASNNFHAARRYPNLIDAEAIRCFLDTTHQAYWQRLRKYFGKTIQAVFTDEPSLIAVNIGPLPDHVRKKVRIVDPLDETLKPLPSVPWVNDLPRLCRERYGHDIMTVQMLKNQISFALVDHELLSDAKVRHNSIEVAKLPFKALVIPAEVRLPKSADKVVQEFKAAGGKVFRGQPPGPGIDFKSLAEIYTNGALDPPSDRVVIGRFLREDWNIMLMVNVSPQPYQGKITVNQDFNWLHADPDTGKIESAKRNQAETIDVSLPPQSALFLVGSP